MKGLPGTAVSEKKDKFNKIFTRTLLTPENRFEPVLTLPRRDKNVGIWIQCHEIFFSVTDSKRLPLGDLRSVV